VREIEPRFDPRVIVRLVLLGPPTAAAAEAGAQK